MEPIDLDRDGTRLHALWRPGTGTPLVIVPGVMTDARGWRHVAAAIAGPEPILILNRRGRAPSGDLGEDYSVETEVRDLLAWLRHLGAPVRLFGWSYGGLIAIEAATRTAAVRQLLAYEPVIAPFAAHAIPALRAATEAGDLDRAVQVVSRDISRTPPERLAALRDSPAWAPLRAWAAPVAGETVALNAFTPDPGRWAGIAVPIDLIIGAENTDTEPYGTAFAAVARLLPGAAVHVLAGQGHLAHVTGADRLGRLIGDLTAARGASLPG
ncbi:alpha/beta fold hydrolase [Catenuloplanes atrovinosus]|uniref:Pimeloyl-ACP methyl ester carboxylesterase n=1 Tax=Catenuloplanes atrovinosus TaxID=137266 RepID=A0AAE3YPT4_9ACTN|nr:alpha/beta hydrolase [Catenuloplanes atrovinosus]MDR7276198.1 pimeloyl-ACP methyl ester carboxylesterase [Catenuloplanes atrovinosus]